MSFEWRELVRHMVDEVDYLQRSTTHTTKEDFLSDETLRRAFERSVEILGEAANKLPPEVTERFADIPWRRIIAMRHRVVHAYFGVDYDLLWEVATVNAPALGLQLRALLQGEE